MERKTARVKELANFFAVHGLEGVECLHAHYLKHRFRTHSHTGYALGVITAGALGFDYRGEHLVASTGTINTVVPGEPHTGEAAGESGWSYRMLYLQENIVRSILHEADIVIQDIVFTPGLVHDSTLAQDVATAHSLFEHGSLSLLSRQSLIRRLVIQWIQRHGQGKTQHHTAASGTSPALERVRQKLEDEYEQDISLEELALMAHVSPWHLNRAFRFAYGLPPHRYQTMVRVRHAKNLLLSGVKVADAALAVGFYDQSHLTRYFISQVGVSPGRYSKSVQEKR